MTFGEIKTFTRASYQFNMPWKDLEKWIEDNSKEKVNEEGYEGLNLNPDFQRIHVWTEEKQKAYVEFRLRYGNSGKDLLFNYPGYATIEPGEMVLVDGKQRLEAVRKFLRNELRIFEGYYLKDFTDHLRPDMDFLICINDLKTKKEILQWYLEINDGGVVHTKDEIDKVKDLLKLEK